jgi:hypothetical protein
MKKGAKASTKELKSAMLKDAKEKSGDALKGGKTPGGIGEDAEDPNGYSSGSNDEEYGKTFKMLNAVQRKMWLEQ